MVSFKQRSLSHSLPLSLSVKDFFDSNEVAYSDQSELLLGELSGLKDAMMENLDKVIERE